MSGIFITLEGGEGCGKTTLCNHLVHLLEKEGIDFLMTREPGGVALSEQIREILLKKKEIDLSERSELLLFLAARAQNLKEAVLPALKEGKVVISDRYNDSSVAYQGFARGLGYEEVKQVCHFITEGLIPDLTFYLDLDPEIGMQRTRKAEDSKIADRIDGQKIEFHHEVRKGYLKIAADEPSRIHILDATQPLEEVLKQAQIKVLEVISQFKTSV